MAVGSFWPPTSYAYHYITCNGHARVWESEPDRLRASEVTFPSENPFREALGDVVDLFNTNPGDFRFELSYDERYVREGGSQSEIWGSTDADLHRGYNAMTWVRSTCYGGIKTVDIVFNASTVWAPGTDKEQIQRYGGAAASFRATLMHELGHAMGLVHEGDEYNVMGQAREHLNVNCGAARAYLGEDASDGAYDIYGANASAGEDVGVVHWKWLEEVDFPPYGSYSEHTRTRIYPVSEPVIFWVEDEEPVYLLRNGQTVEVEFTYENNGASRQPYVPVGFYLSTNDCITTSDTRVGGFAADLGRRNVWTTAKRITLPDDLEVGRDYYIGAIIDEADALEEVNEQNNATYVARFRVNPVPYDPPE
jgi:hypothetical protein